MLVTACRITSAVRSTTAGRKAVTALSISIVQLCGLGVLSPCTYIAAS